MGLQQLQDALIGKMIECYVSYDGGETSSRFTAEVTDIKWLQSGNFRLIYKLKSGVTEDIFLTAEECTTIAEGGTMAKNTPVCHVAMSLMKDN